MYVLVLTSLIFKEENIEKLAMVWGYQVNYKAVDVSLLLSLTIPSSLDLCTSAPRQASQLRGGFYFAKHLGGKW